LPLRGVCWIRPHPVPNRSRTLPWSPTASPCLSVSTAERAIFNNATAAESEYTGQGNVTYFPYADSQLHDIGGGLADGIPQGEASGSQFRTAPLWGIGKRIFFLHDGRTPDLLQAILAHGGEATRVIANFNGLSSGQNQDILNFLRGL
jgi:CxxC motif-containing protein (DUF1111 family)